jgi:predicted nucleic acid-binding protein
MKKVLIDTSIWIDYFNGEDSIILILEELIDSDRIAINQLILSELLPYILFKKESDLADILKTIDQIPVEIRWDKIIEYQVKNLKNGINKVGIPDLIILDNCIQNDVELFTLDKHFTLMAKVHKFKLFRM